jgi:MFS family permease
MSSGPETGKFAPLYIPEFRYYIVARFFYIMALRMITTIIGFKLFQLTQDTFAVGFAGLAEFIPVFSLALYAGHLIDRSDKRTMLLRGILGYSVCIVGLLLVSSMFFEESIPKHLLKYFYYAIIFFTGIVRAFAGPTSNAIIAQLVPKIILPFAVNMSSSTWLIASITGHASAGFLIAWLGVHNTFYVVLVCVLIAATMISLIPKLPIMLKDNKEDAWKSVKQGLNYVFDNKILLGAISLDLFAVLFGGVVAFIPEVAATILKTGPIAFGWLNAAADIGSAFSILMLTIFPLKKEQGKKLMLAVAAFGICIISFGLSDVYWISFVALLLSGSFDGLSVIVRSTVLQLTTPDNMRGRVSSVNSMFINSSNELGQFESGVSKRLLGNSVPLAIIFGGSMTLLVVIITWFKAPSLRKFEY